MYNLIMPAAYDFGSSEFDDAVRAAGRKAFAEALSDGRKFEIRWTVGQAIVLVWPVIRR